MTSGINSGSSVSDTTVSGDDTTEAETGSAFHNNSTDQMNTAKAASDLAEAASGSAEALSDLAEAASGSAEALSDLAEAASGSAKAVIDSAASVSDSVVPAAYRVKSRGREVAETILPPILLGICVLGFWYLISYLVLDESRRFLLEPPHKVLEVGFLDFENFLDIMGGLWSSARVAMIGLVIAITIGFFLAIIMSQAKVVERAVFPFMVTLQAIPILAIVPLISFWWGTGQRSRVVVCIIISLFPIIVNTLFGLQSADRAMHDLFTLHHASRLVRLRKLMFPAAMPAVFAGLRISAGLSVIGAIVGDFFFGRGDVGIGTLLKRYANRIQGEELLASVIMSSALGIIVFWVFGWIQNLVIGKWHSSIGHRS